MTADMGRCAQTLRFEVRIRCVASYVLRHACAVIVLELCKGSRQQEGPVVERCNMRKWAGIPGGV